MSALPISPLAEFHPVQAQYTPKRVPRAVAMAAYEVYAAVYGEQLAMVSEGCRGGFSGGEYIAFLYARAFPRDQWRARVEEVFKFKSEGHEK